MPSSKQQELFFELLLVCTGAKDSLWRQYGTDDWNEALSIAQDQAIVGALLGAIERLPTEHQPNKVLLL